jgi:hypothetical protein
MKIAILAALFALALGAGDQSMTGVITDTMCGKSHAMMGSRNDADCVRMCVKGSSQYALYDGKDVWKLSDQKTPAQFAAKRVKVTGTVNQKARSIQVTSIEAAN